jgi:hypothetical protein
MAQDERRGNQANTAANVEREKRRRATSQRATRASTGWIASAVMNA